MSIPASSEPVRLALIGAGRWGRNYIRTIAGLPGLVLTRLVSTNPDSGALVPPGCAVDADWRRTVTSTDVDAVIIATPPASHAEITLAAIAAGKPVLVEKPLTLDVAEATSIRDAATAARVPVWVEHTQVFNPAWAALRAHLPTIGPIQAIRAQAGNRGPYRVGIPMLWDWGAHEMSQILDLVAATPERCEAAYLERGHHQDGESATVELRLAFAGGLTATALLCNHMDKCRRFAVHGEKGILLIDDLAVQKLTRHPATPGFAWPDGPGEPLAVEAESPLTRAVRLFAEAVRAGSVTFESLDLGLRVVRALTLCHQSAEAA